MAAFTNTISSTPLQELVNQQCSICMDSLYFQNSQPVEINTCNHKFHKKCLNDWCGRNNNRTSTCNCPYCRNEFNYKTELKKLGTQIRNKVRAATNSEINDINYSDVYEEDAIKEVKTKINHMKRDGTRRKAGQQTTGRNRRSPNRSLSASSLTPSSEVNVPKELYNKLRVSIRTYARYVPSSFNTNEVEAFLEFCRNSNNSQNEYEHVRDEDIEKIIISPKQWVFWLGTNIPNNRWDLLKFHKITNAYKNILQVI